MKSTSKSVQREALNSYLDPIPPEVKQYFFKDRQPPNLLTDYDVLGFDADHCLVKYNVRAVVELLIKCELEDLHELSYPD